MYYFIIVLFYGPVTYYLFRTQVPDLLAIAKATPFEEDNPSSYNENIERSSGFLVFNRLVER